MENDKGKTAADNIILFLLLSRSFDTLIIYWMDAVFVILH